MSDLILVARPKSAHVEPAPVAGGGLIALVSKAKKQSAMAVAGKQQSKAMSAAQVAKALHKAANAPLAKTFTQYIGDDRKMEPAGEMLTTPTLDAHAYRIVNTMMGIGFIKTIPETDELYMFDNSVMQEVLKEIDTFWELKSDYEKLGVLHNRGIMLYGPPGTGKTSLLHQTAEMVSARGDVVFYANSIYTLLEGLDAFREIEPDRKVVVALEDADEYMGYQERDFLQLLDGEKSISGILYLATTNYIDRISPRLLRPGRFDKKVFVGPPPLAGRAAYLTNKLKGVEQDGEISRLAKETDGLSFGDLRELVTAVYALKEPVDEVLFRLRKGKKSLAGVKQAGKVVTVTEPSLDGLCSVQDIETDYDDRTRGHVARKGHGEPRFYLNGRQITRGEYDALAKDMGDDTDSPGDTTLSMPPCPKCMKSDGVYPVDDADGGEPPITDSADSIKPGQTYVCSMCKCMFKDKTLPPVDGPGVPRKIQRSAEPTDTKAKGAVSVNAACVSWAEGAIKDGKVDHGAFDGGAVPKDKAHDHCFLAHDSGYKPDEAGHYMFPIASGEKVSRKGVGTAEGYAEKNGDAGVAAAAKRLGEACDKSK